MFFATVTISCAGRNFLSLDCFLLSWGVCCVCLRCQMMNVCVALCLMGFVRVDFCWNQTLSGTGTTSFRGRTIIVLLLYVILGLLAFYSKFVTTFPTGSAGHNLTCRFNPLSVAIFTFSRGLLRPIRLVSWLLYCYRWWCGTLRCRLLVIVRSLPLVVLVFKGCFELHGGVVLFVVGCWLLCDCYDWLYWFSTLLVVHAFCTVSRCGFLLRLIFHFLFYGDLPSHVLNL